MRVTAERTIEDLYREQALGLLRFALLPTGDLPTAEDPVQDAFLGLHRHWGHGAGSDKGPADLMMLYALEYDLSAYHTELGVTSAEAADAIHRAKCPLRALAPAP
jgi:hypothetical protein